jgi:hypothetical protein
MANGTPAMIATLISGGFVGMGFLLSFLLLEWRLAN